MNKNIIKEIILTIAEIKTFFILNLFILNVSKTVYSKYLIPINYQFVIIYNAVI